MALLKKTAAILLLLLLLFNFIGYKLLFYYAMQQADRHTQSLLDKEQYNDEELLTITVPLSNPYQVSQAAFERISGEIELDGKIYHYVKRKIDNGSLVLLCLPDKKKTPLKSAERQFFKMVNDLDESNDASKGTQNKAGIFKAQTTDYDSCFVYPAIDNPFTLSLTAFPIFDSPVPAPPVAGSPERPPGYFLI